MSAERSSGGALVVSLDLDLAWGGAAEPNPADIEGGLAVIPRILELFEEWEIHATWAFVGLAFARDREDARRFAPRWVAHEQLARREIEVAPARYFAPELVATIAARPHQEIGSLTFSHYDCTRPGQTAGQFEADLAAAVAIAQRDGITLRSLVFPGDQGRPEHLPILARHQIRCFRGRRPGWAHRPSRSPILGALRRALCTADNYSLLIPDLAISLERLVERRGGGPLEIPACRYLRPHDPSLRAIESLRAHRMLFEMITAAEAGGLYHLWLRPLELGAHVRENLQVLGDLLRTARALAELHGFRSLTMAELAEHADLARGG
ncbi:MAG: polysaccharide deacetylase family protein [Enhygromyxa sp.]